MKQTNAERWFRREVCIRLGFSKRWTFSDYRPDALSVCLMSRCRRLLPLSRNRLAQICYGICQDELPGFAYFGTQFKWEVRLKGTVLSDVQ